ncbi:hypothetical protein K2173_024104 [Erythroxylum novogranatense]|uniref:Uncharacterized protein n=1 Tax=Erythroxylum novogranatense TaxID=1862640 RepID=A0AAV8UFZ8_9ROSI|nr:hypothetical protein K2173_024104 [Erythroxylum novogranatense]
MELSISCPSADSEDLDGHIEKICERPMGNSSEPVSFKGCDLTSSMAKSYGPGKMILEGSLSFKGREWTAIFSFKSPSSTDADNKLFASSFTPKSGCGHLRSDILSNHRNQAAVKLQKVYKSFRTRRQLADCAVVVEQRWWKLLDFAELKRSSISFFDIEKPETAISRWSRARTKAAKVGKGLSKDAKARKLALQHWLEAIDPRHRYGHNLQFYYVKWLHCQSTQPFFYWLDIGEGKEVNLERCPKSKLQQQCIKYLGPTERKAYEVVIEGGKLVYRQSGKLFDTIDGPVETKWIFVLSTSKTLYIGQKSKGKFQHSSFLAGGATLSAGRIAAENGIIKAVWPHSGHYLPTEENFQEFMSFLKEHNIDLTNIKQNPTEAEEEAMYTNSSGCGIRDNQSTANEPQETELTNIDSLNQENVESGQPKSNDYNADLQTSNLSHGLCSKIAKLKIPSRNDIPDIFRSESSHNEPSNSSAEEGYESGEDSYLTEEDFMFMKMNLFDSDEEEEEEELIIPKEKIMKRIDSHKGMKSYQLAKQLSSKWTTGAGPRIGCMRDYPPELQLLVLEQSHLSPRGTSATIRHSSPLNPRASKPTSLHRKTTSEAHLVQTKSDYLELHHLRPSKMPE